MKYPRATLRKLRKNGNVEPVPVEREHGQMTDWEKSVATTQASASQKSLELLYDYTKFHIGVYLTLTASYLTAAFANFSGKPVLPLNPLFIAPAVMFTMLAGFAGGVIVSSLTQWVGGTSNDFLMSRIGPWDWDRLRFEARKWTYIEHTSFWLGLICAVLSFIPAYIQTKSEKPKIECALVMPVVASSASALATTFVIQCPKQ